MGRDELDDRVRQAAETERAVVDRIVSAALARADGAAAAGNEATPVVPGRLWPDAFPLIAACFVAVVLFSAWWGGRQSASLPAGGARALVKPTEAGRVIRVTTGDGTTWILSTTPDDDWMPAGSVVVLGGAEGR